jgi:hypothetical protein
MTNVLNILYFVLLLIILVIALKHDWVAIRQFPIYIIGVLVIELTYYSSIYVNPKLNISFIYNFYYLLSLSYFYYFFTYNLKDTIIKTIYSFLFLFCLTLNIVFFYSYGILNFQYRYIIVLALFNIAYSLIWLLNQINNPDKYAIQRKMEFWFCCGLLLWSCFAIFRLIPMYLFQKKDPYFSYVLKNIFIIINIITYLLYLKGIQCQKDLKKTPFDL